MLFPATSSMARFGLCVFASPSRSTRPRLGTRIDQHGGAVYPTFQSPAFEEEILTFPPNYESEGEEMSHRYTVYEHGRAFASVHAPTPEEAVEIACRKADGHDAAGCVAVAQRAGATSPAPREANTPIW
jgi:hypothetical protein